KKTILAAATASALLLAGCGPAGPAPETGLNEWVEVDDIGVRVGVEEYPPLINVEINNHRDKQIDRESIELVSIEGKWIKEDIARDTFEQEFVNDIPAGEIATGSIVSGTGDDAKMT